MSNLDNAGLYYIPRFYADENLPNEGREIVAEYKQLVEKYRKFIREFSVGEFNMIYRDQLKLNYNAMDYFLDIGYDDLKMFDEDAANKIKRYPATFLPALEAAAKRVADEITHPRPAGQEEMEDIQVRLLLSEQAISIRKIKGSDVSQLVKVSGIIVAASQVRSRATRVSLQCRTCKHTINDVEIKPGLEGFQLPRKCGSNQAGQLQRCPLDPYHVVPDKSKCVDFQVLKLQETPEDVPHSEMPRHLQLYVDRYLTDKVVPGNRVTITGVFSIKKVFNKQGGKEPAKTMSGIRTPYLRVIGIQIQTAGVGRADHLQFMPEDERQFRELAKNPNVYEIIAKSIAPSIYGSEDIKKAIACLLFGGSRKRLPDGLTRRGDINVLLLGDPGTAKSQLLKFVEKVAPIAVYTSGKGSSAAGLTASVIRDPQSKSFIMEGGAMVLADGGVVCIDEFDKMREDDRVAIHEAMEQQTISIAKAGITTTLNSRCSVLAAANSVFGRWDDTRGDENIDFMPTILSRFDTIFVVKDVHDATRDAQLAKHVIAVHSKAGNMPLSQLSTPHPNSEETTGELTLEFLKKMIAFARLNCAPRLSERASEKLINNYVQMRNPGDNKSRKHQSSISITVRQLEAVVRLSECLAKMELLPFAEERHVEEAMRLFNVSTIASAKSGSLAGVEGFTTSEDQESFNRIEQQLKKRFGIGTYVSQELIVDEFSRQSYAEPLVKKVIEYCIMRGEIQHRMHRKLLYRVK
ncbi:MCM2/3/5 family domain-containing protein [Ditylenchus destructor]|nr:MCM2/3/5 family domain-containing protein [Ditylenchus destructor]